MGLMGLLAFWLFILGVAFVQWPAFLDGMQLWLNWSVSINSAIFAIIYMFAMSILAAPIVFYGAYVAWGWPWYLAGMLALPAVAITMVLIRFRGIKGLFARV